MVWQQHHSVLRKSRDRRLVCIIRSCQVIRDFAFTQDKIAHIKASPITEKHQVCHLVPIWEDSLCKKGKTATECDRDKTQCKDKTPSVFPKSHVEKYPCVIERRGGEERRWFYILLFQRENSLDSLNNMKVTIRSAAVTLKTAVRLKRGSFLKHLSPVWDVNHRFVTECGSMVLHR